MKNKILTLGQARELMQQLKDHCDAWGKANMFCSGCPFFTGGERGETCACYLSTTYPFDYSTNELRGE